MKTINIVTDFSEFPGLRHCTISEKSGEEFYHLLLNKAFKEAFERGERLTVNLDATDGYASSFLDEAFGNLVYDFTLEAVKARLDVVSNDEPSWKEMIENESFEQWEKRRRKNLSPKVTIDHQPWFRLRDNKIELNVWEVPA